MDKRKLFSNSFNLDLCKRITKCFVWSVALYVVEISTLTKADRKQLEAIEVSVGLIYIADIYH